MAIRFTVTLTPSFQRDLENLSLEVQKRILEALKRLESFGPLTNTGAFEFFDPRPTQERYLPGLAFPLKIPAFS